MTKRIISFDFGNCKECHFFNNYCTKYIKPKKNGECKKWKKVEWLKY